MPLSRPTRASLRALPFALLVAFCSTVASRSDASYHNYVMTVSAGTYHTCYVYEYGTVSCFGGNYFGQLGDGTTTDRLTSVQVANLTDAVQVAAGGAHTCALTSAGAVKCWGANDSGQLGDGTTTRRLTPVTVSGITAKAISAGGGFTCALTTTNKVRCWGDNSYGQLGDGTTTNRLRPVAPTGLDNYVSNEVVAGSQHTCAAVTSGATQSMRCWGDNVSGQLGDGTTTRRLTSVAVKNITATKSIAAGMSHSCAVVGDGTARCWGQGGALGDGTTTQRLTPVAVKNLTNIVAIDAGGHTCAVTTDLYVHCWGPNGWGQVGNGTTSTSSVLTPFKVTWPAYDISAGFLHSCTEGQVCWGGNNFGQLGDGTTTNRSKPTVWK